MSSFASLPLELVSRIIGMVHEQDEAWSAVGVDQGCLYRPSRVKGRPGAEEQVPLGRWSPEYGRGIRALVRVDRRIRTAAVPFLYKSVSTRAAIAPYFRVNVLGQGLGLLVQELDCFAVKPEEVISLACALEGLPNLSSLVVGADIMSFLHEGGTGPEQGLLVQALKGALGRITSLEIGGAMSHLVAHALSHLDKRRLRRLVFQHGVSLMPLTEELVAVIERLEGLVDVELDASDEQYVAEMQRRLYLPHVRTLTLKYNSHESETDYSDGLLLAHRVAPAVEVLSFDDLCDEDVAPSSAELPRPLLSNLRVLRIDINDLPSFSSLRLGDLPALEHLHISSISTVDDVFPDEASFPSFAPTLRSITVAHTLPLSPSPSPSLLAKCDELGIRLIATSSPPAIDYARLSSKRSVPRLGLATRAPTEDDAADLERLFGWAGARARWLLRVGDGRAMEELSAAALRLRERFVIEHS